MSGICSAHHDQEPGCILCASTPKDVFPDWDERHAEWEKAGLLVLRACKHCNFEFYKTVTMCPCCCTENPL